MSENQKIDSSSISTNTKLKANFNDVTDQILFCQNGITSLNVSSNDNCVTSVSQD